MKTIKHQANKTILAQLREPLCLSQSSLAKKLRLTQQFIAELEVKAKNPSIETIKKILVLAERYGFKIVLEDLLEDYRKH